MRRTRRTGLLAAIIVAGVLLLLGPGLAGFWIDWLWFGEVHQRPAWLTMLGARIGLGTFFGLSLAALTYLNIWIARKSSPAFSSGSRGPEWRRAAAMVAREGVAVFLVGGALVIGGLGALIAAGRWEEWLRFLHPVTYGKADPIFHVDLGFYLFRYPFLRFLSGWAFNTSVLVLVATAATYYLDGAIAVLQGRARIPSAVRIHLSLLLCIAALARSLDYWLDRYGLLLQPGGVLYGAGYTDLHARLPALTFLAAASAVAALGFLANARVRALWLPGVALALMVVAQFTVGGLYPALMQRFQVAPNEQVREREYIQHHLDATREAYGLGSIGGREYALSRPLQNTDLRAERDTLDNIRLWDYRVLSQTYQRLQGLRSYYDVSEVDVDRYTIDGKYRQVMLAARELVTGNLETRRWVTERLQYTHGYGLVMSAVNEADPAGRPAWLIHDLPLKAPADLPVQVPQLYFGRRSDEFAITPSRTEEFDFQAEAGSNTSRYQGAGGIPVGNIALQSLFSMVLGDWNITISDQVRSESRILIRRRISERVARIAPFLRFDRDPYLVLQAGRLIWLQDAYVTASSFPYSQPTEFAETGLRGAFAGELQPMELGGFNYIRNSVKVAVDAYSGAVTFYAVDADEPLLASYRKAFPSLFTDVATAPAELRAHFRYPEDLFHLQSRKLLRFHVTKPDIFYAHSDDWDIPTEVTQQQAGTATDAMEPYYVVMRLPGERQEEFALILPFKTRNGTTMTAWLTGRCDGEHYGELRLYRFGTEAQVDIPEQVDATIQQDPRISAETTVWNQQGSRVIYGNLLVLPVGGSLLYVKPLYLVATQANAQTGIPELKRVILVEKRGRQFKVVMEPTLGAALTALVGGVPDEPSGGEAPRGPAVGAPATSPGLEGAAGDADAAFEAAERAQRAGDWAEYGKQLQRARTAIKRLRAALDAAREGRSR